MLVGILTGVCLSTVTYGIARLLRLRRQPWADVPINVLFGTLLTGNTFHWNPKAILVGAFTALMVSLALHYGAEH